MADHVRRGAPHLQDGCTKGRRARLVLVALWVLIALVTVQATAQPAGQPVAEDTAGLSQPTAPPPETPEGLIRAIQQRETELTQRAADLSKKEERLKILEQDIRTMVDKDVKLRDEVERTSKPNAPQGPGGHGDRFGQLAKVYEQMAPDDAAARIDKMDETVALKILATAKPKATAKILTGLPAAKAARLSEQLAIGQR